MKKVRTIILVIVIAVSMLGLAGCFNSGADGNIPDIIDPNAGINHSPQEDTQELKIGTGTYVGQIDNSSVEIIVSGVPEDMATRAFRLSPDLREGFEQQDLQNNTPVKFEYYVDSQDQWVLMNIGPM